MDKGAIPIYALPKYGWPKYSLPGSPGGIALIYYFYDIDTMDVFKRIGETKYLEKL